jgi:hypothetical protein
MVNVFIKIHGFFTVSRRLMQTFTFVGQNKMGGPTAPLKTHQKPRSTKRQVLAAQLQGTNQPQPHPGLAFALGTL